MRSGILPEILGTGPEFILGRALFSMVWQGAQVIGYAGGGLLLTVIGPRGALAVDSASFLGSALLVRIGIRRRAAAAPSEVGMVRDSLQSLGTVMRDRPMRRLLLLHWLIPTCALAPEALIAPYVHVVHGPSRDVGILLSALAAGMLLSNLLAGRLLTTARQRRLMVPAALLAVTPIIVFAAPIGVALSVAMFFASGLGAWWSLGRDVAFVAAAPPPLLARALAIDQSGLMVVQGIGFAFWGALAEVVPLRTTIGIAGVLGVLIITALGHTPETYRDKNRT